MQHYRAPRWLPGGNLQTIWPALFSAPRPWRRPPTGASAGTRPTATSSTSTSSPRPPPRRRCWCCSTAWKAAAQPVRAGLRQRAAQRGWAYAVPHFRGCSGELNRAPRAYHSGDFEEIGWILERLRAAPGRAAAGGGHLAGRQRAAALGGGGRRQRRRHGARGGRGVLAHRPGRRRPRHRPRLQPAGLHAHVPAHDEAQGAGQVAAAPGAVRPRAAGRGAHAVRVRRRLHRAAARLSRHRRLLAARVGQAAPGAHPHPGAGAQRAQRPLRAGGLPARGRTGGALRHAVAAGAGRARRLSARALSRPRAGHAAGGGRLAGRSTAGVRLKLRPWTRSSRRRCSSGRTCRTATAGWRWTRAATGTCATTDPGRRALPAGQGQPHRARQAAGLHPPQLRRTTSAAAGSSRTGRSASTWSWRRRPGCGGWTRAGRARRPVAHQPPGERRPGARRLARRTRPPVPGHRPRLRPRAHAGHRRGGAGRRGRRLAATRDGVRAHAGAFGYVLRPQADGPGS